MDEEDKEPTIFGEIILPLIGALIMNLWVFPVGVLVYILYSILM